MQPTPPRHVIQLGNAWEPPEPTGDRLRLARRFGRPSGLGPDQRVFLVIASATVAADVRLNGTPLPPIAAGGGRWTHDVTPLLRDRNELSIVMPAVEMPDADATGSRGRGRPLPELGMVSIEITADG